MSEEKSKMEIIKEFIQTCPLLKDGKVNVDYIKDENDETILDEYNQYCDEEGCYYDGEEIGIYIAAAWANSESAFENADWRIVVC